VDLAQFEAVAQTMGNCMPLYTGQGGVYGHTGNRPPYFQPYDTFQCSDGWVYVGALGDPMVSRLASFLGLDPAQYNFATVSKDAAAVGSERGREFDRRLRDYCTAHSAVEVETELNKVQVGCARVFNMRDQYEDEHYNARDMTVPVLDHQSGVPIRVYGVVPKMSLTPGRVWRGAPSIGQDTTDILSRLLHLDDVEIERLYEEKAVHRTEPFLQPQVDAVHP
jgi:crotonobetainyl-CoA:carnitine CoA-transferase CaiB-like acyl-CoA transferase